VLIRDRRFVGYALCSGLIMGAMFAYIAGSPFVLQDIHGLSPQAFSAVFALNGLGIMAGTFASGRLVGRLSPERIVALGVSQAGAGAAILLAGLHSTPLTLAGFFLVVSAVGLVNPAATTLALADHAAVAGSASALLGVAQFLIGAAAAPLVGIAGSTSALPMSLTIAALVAAAGVAMRATGPARRRATQPASAA
jgi:DHA1 family bicyclomycin/chloramphenicol resistance-like MFS transporter